MPLQRLAQLGLTLPAAPQPLGAYVPAVTSGNLVFLSGQLPRVDGKLPAEYTGKVGGSVALEEAQAAARQAVLNALAIIQAHVGLEHVTRVVRLVGYVNSTADFTRQPQVLDAASDLLAQVFGAQGVHARLALGAVALPVDACIEIELIVEIAG